MLVARDVVRFSKGSLGIGTEGGGVPTSKASSIFSGASVALPQLSSFYLKNVIITIIVKKYIKRNKLGE